MVKLVFTKTNLARRKDHFYTRVYHTGFGRIIEKFTSWNQSSTFTIHVDVSQWTLAFQSESLVSDTTGNRNIGC